MTEQDKFEEFVRSTINELDPRPNVPRDAMWAQIDAARRFRRAPQRRLPAWSRWSLAVAAALVVGIGLGRLTRVQQTPLNPQQQPVATSGGTTTLDNNASSMRFAALSHLGRAEVLLTSVRSGSVDTQMVQWAGDMLITTRLLLDAAAAQDARLIRLLEDLELLLTQIASTAVTASPAELDLIQRGIEQTDVLPRLRATLPATLAAGT